ncbi:hypothetical protein JCM14076_18980 [Methylosoma difficile]
MLNTNKLTVFQALQVCTLIDLSLEALENTAPGIIAELGGAEKVSKQLSINSLNLAPVPKVDEAIWAKMARTQQAKFTGNQGLAINPGQPDPAHYV